MHSALFLIKSEVPPIELIQLISKMYDDCGKGPGRLTRNALHSILGSTLAITFEESLDIFARIDTNRRGFVATGLKLIILFVFFFYLNLAVGNRFSFLGIEELIEYLHTKPEYKYVFQATSDAKKSRNTTKQKTL